MKIERTGWEVGIPSLIFILSERWFHFVSVFPITSYSDLRKASSRTCVSPAKMDQLKFYSCPSNTFFSVLSNLSPALKWLPFSFYNYVLGVWRSHCLVWVKGRIINKERQALFLLQSFFTWSETKETVGVSKESSSQWGSFFSLPSDKSVHKERLGLSSNYLSAIKLGA